MIFLYKKRVFFRLGGIPVLFSGELIAAFRSAPGAVAYHSHFFFLKKIRHITTIAMLTAITIGSGLQNRDKDSR